MENEKVYRMSFFKVYPLLEGKALKKGWNKKEEDKVVRLLTGSEQPELDGTLE